MCRAAGDSGPVANRHDEPSTVGGSQMVSEPNQPGASLMLPVGERGVLSLLEEPQRELQLTPGREGRKRPLLDAGREIRYIGIATEQGVPQGSKVLPAAEFAQCDGEVRGIVAPTAVVEVDRRDHTPPEQEVLLVQVGMNQAEGIGAAAESLGRGLDAVDRIGHDLCSSRAAKVIDGCSQVFGDIT